MRICPIEQSEKVWYSDGMKRRAFLISAVCVLLVSCGSTKVAEESGAKFNAVYVTDKAKFALLPTSAIEKKIDALQHIKAQFGEKEFESDCLLVADDEKLIMTILNTFGTTMGELNYNNDLVVFNSELFPKSIKAEYIVADIQFCLYRVDSLQKAFEDIGLRFVVSIADGEQATIETRSIFDGKKEIARMEKTMAKTGTQIIYTNFLRDYSYTLQGAF